MCALVHNFFSHRAIAKSFKIILFTSHDLHCIEHLIIYFLIVRAQGTIFIHAKYSLLRLSETFFQTRRWPLYPGKGFHVSHYSIYPELIKSVVYWWYEVLLRFLHWRKHFWFAGCYQITTGCNVVNCEVTPIKHIACHRIDWVIKSDVPKRTSCCQTWQQLYIYVFYVETAVCIRQDTDWSRSCRDICNLLQTTPVIR